MLMKNDSALHVRIPELKVDLAAGECVEIPDGYCLPRRSAGGMRIPSIVENLAPQMRPADEGVWIEWLKAPKDEWHVLGGIVPAKPKEAFVAEGLPEGLAEIKAAQESVRVAAAKKAAEKVGLNPDPVAPAEPELTRPDPVLKPRKGKKE